MATNPDVNPAQQGFSGGMNLLSDAMDLKPNEYVYAHNVRNRNEILEPTTQHLLVDSPAGLKQGLYTFEDFMLLFVAGKAYYKNVSESTWHQIASFDMSDTADVIYACAVPEGTYNFQRKAVDDADAKAGSKFNRAILLNGNGSGLVCQDGETQPWLIYIVGGVPVARLTQTYAAWDSVSGTREYVPIGTIMLYFDDILYVASSKVVFRSVTGRPLDFVVNILADGAKGGDATTTPCYAFTENVTCLAPLATQGYDGATASAFLASTLGNFCFALVPNRNATIFGEPLYIKIPLFSATVINQFSFVDILGDFAFIDPEGIRSFNAILQQKNEGRNSPISLKISRAFQNFKKQPLQSPSRVAAVVFDNYAIFAVVTAYGNSLVVYDTLHQVFCSFDWNQFGPVKKFAVTQVDKPRLFGITFDDQLVEYYGSTEYSRAVLMTREWFSGSIAVEIKTENLRTLFDLSNNSGQAKATAYIDGAPRQSPSVPSYKRDLPDASNGLLYPVTYPALWGKKRKRVNLVFPFNGAVGVSVGFLISWTGGAKLTDMCAGFTPIDINQAQSSKSTQY